jgi:hypothetical protein
MMDKVSSFYISSHQPEAATAARLLRKQLISRHVGEQAAGSAALQISLLISPDLPPESFAIQGEDRHVEITGGDWRGLIYGAGKFLHTSKFYNEGFVPSTYRGFSQPARPLRGIYFATHFHNFYHDGPVADIQCYLEDLALWGVNALVVWFDMHHFNGIDDPAALAMIQRLSDLLRAAKNVGMQAGLGVLANEAYANSPEALRADWTAGHNGYFAAPGGHYHVELCPHKPGATELLLRWRREMLEAFKPVGVDFTWIWPYDQGGCTCSNCTPWGSNSFLKLAPQVAEVSRQVFPGIKVILSTWYFDHFVAGEWTGLAKAFSDGAAWVDYLLADDYGGQYPPHIRQHGVPGGLPLVGFPEISMYRCTPWGGFGANPLPGYIQNLWEQVKDLQAGGFPYSEGIFEDINKVLCAQLYWGEHAQVEEILREYTAYEYSPVVVELVLDAIQLLETTNARRRVDDSRQVNDTIAWLSPGQIPPRFVIEHPEQVGESCRLLEAADRMLAVFTRNAWRWRILLLRGKIDREMTEHDFQITAACEGLMGELVQIYHAQKADYVVTPPTRAAIAAARGL